MTVLRDTLTTGVLVRRQSLLTKGCLTTCGKSLVGTRGDEDFSDLLVNCPQTTSTRNHPRGSPAINHAFNQMSIWEDIHQFYDNSDKNKL